MSSKTTERGMQRPRIRYAPDYVRTDGGEAGELASAYGLDPDPWQSDLLDVWLGRDAADKFVASKAGLSVPRQNGKNAVLEMRELYGLCIIGESILHTAHEVKTARKAFVRLAGFFENERQYPELAEMVVSIRRTNGQEAIYLNNGAQIEFSARSRGAARGFTVDLVVFDEAQELTDEQLEALLPTLAAAPLGNRQFIYMGTPPPPGSPGTVFRRERENAIEETSKRLAWHEWSVEEVGDITDRERWFATNPALGIRLEEEFIEEEMTSMSADGFARERLGYWSAMGSDIFPIPHDLWEQTRAAGAINPGKYHSYGVKFSYDGTSVALSGATKLEDGRIYCELIMHEPVDNGTAYLLEWLVERKDRTAAIVLDGITGAAPLYDSLLKRGFSKKAVKIANSADVVSSTSIMLDALRAGSLVHKEQPALDESIETSIKRVIGNSGGWGFGGMNPTPSESFALAHYAAATTRRKPGRKVRVL